MAGSIAELALFPRTSLLHNYESALCRASIPYNGIEATAAFPTLRGILIWFLLFHVSSAQSVSFELATNQQRAHDVLKWQ